MAFFLAEYMVKWKNSLKMAEGAWKEGEMTG